MTAQSALGKIAIMLEMIKFEHTIFALPFALTSMLVAANGLPNARIILWILVAMVGARSAAMAFNRIADAKIDAANPRTSSRALPRGRISMAFAWIFTSISAALLIIAASQINKLAFALSPVALIVILGYSYSKRFTSLSHIWLGLALGIAPVGAWIAVRGSIGIPSIILSAAVIFWTAGFDIIYSLQDMDFDKKSNLLSLPKRIGPARALFVSRIFHALMIGMLAAFGVLSGLGAFYYTGTAIVAAFLIYEQSLVSPSDISRVNMAFFTMNGCVSIVLLAFAAADVFLK